jgi:hypothetical protein
MLPPTKEKLFKQLMEKNKYSLTTEGFKKFEADWDHEVADWYKKKVLQGDDSILLIHQKCYSDLQEYHQYLQDQKALAATAADQDLSDDLQKTLCKISQKHSWMQQVHAVNPVDYF